MAMLPMQDAELAVQELERVAKLPGIRGVYMATHVNGKNLDDKSFWPVYARCEALGLPIFLHPINPVGAERMRSYHLRNFIGNPTEPGSPRPRSCSAACSTPTPSSTWCCRTRAASSRP